MFSAAHSAVILVGTMHSLLLLHLVTSGQKATALLRPPLTVHEEGDAMDGRCRDALGI